MRIRMWLLLLTISALPVQVGVGSDGPRVPMAPKYEDSAYYRWLNKPVLESRLLDDMENLKTWMKPADGEISLTTERAKDGTHSLRLRARSTGDKDRPPNFLGSYSVAAALRAFPGEDWTRFNRVSVWVYPDMPGFRAVTITLALANAGKEKLPDFFHGIHHETLHNGQWNHIVWEIADLPRDKVTGLQFQETLQGNEPEAAEILTFDFDHLELQRVEPDYSEGWGVAPGRIAFSHSGYLPGSPKSAVASDLAAGEFQVIRQDTGQPVLSKPVEKVKTALGEYQRMDFTELRQPGSYTIRAGDSVTRPFRIGDSVWRDTTWKSLNFFEVYRCGGTPGGRRDCHRDWLGTHGKKSIVINGGWHDAGNIAQLLANTAEITYSMFELAGTLREHGDDPALYRRTVEEAEWGLNWIHKTTFHDGYRIMMAFAGWSNGIIGDRDDMKAEAVNEPGVNYAAAAAEAIAWRVLKDSNPDLANYSLKLAREDWHFAADAQLPGDVTRSMYPNVFEVASAGILASAELYRDTGEPVYAAKAVELARKLVECQQRSYPAGWKVPLAGFFYNSPGKNTIVHYFHFGREQAPIMALAELCRLLPDHPDWMSWYSTIVLNAEYFKTVSRFTEPYGMLPASIYKDELDASVDPNVMQTLSADATFKPSANSLELFRDQVRRGIPLSDHYYLRRFPVWFDFRGNHAVVLSQAKAVAVASALRGELTGSGLAESQLQWIVGRNPFGESAMYGEGYDFVPHFSLSSGLSVGSVSVGFKTNGQNDVPFWPPTTCYTYKEGWVYTVGRWLWLASSFSVPALVTGQAPALSGGPVEFQELASGQVTRVDTDLSGDFSVKLAAGRYKVRAGPVEKTLTLVPSETYRVNLAPGQAVDLTLAAEESGGQVSIRLTARGSGAHRFAIRVHNLRVTEAERQAQLQAGQSQTITWQARIDAADAPWVAVVVPDGDLSQKQEAVSAPRARI